MPSTINSSPQIFNIGITSLDIRSTRSCYYVGLSFAGRVPTATHVVRGRHRGENTGNDWLVIAVSNGSSACEQSPCKFATVSANVSCKNVGKVRMIGAKVTTPEILEKASPQVACQPRPRLSVIVPLYNEEESI